MTTPTADEIREKAIELFMQDCPCCTNTPEDYELKEGGFWEEAKILLMKSVPPELEEHLEENYQTLVEDCIGIVKKIRQISEDVVRYWHELGTRIMEDDSYKMGKWGSGLLVKRLAEDIGVNKSAIYHALRFAKILPDLEKCLTDKKLSPSTWSYIVHNVLYEPKQAKAKPKPEVISKPAVPNVELAKPEFDMMDELLRIVDKTINQPLTRVYFTGASWELRLEIRHYNTKKEVELCQKVGSH